MAEGVAISAVEKLGNCIGIPVLKQFGYLIDYRSNFKCLTSEVDKLAIRTRDVKKDIQEAEKDLHDVYEEVTNWVRTADKTIQESKACFGDKKNMEKAICCGSYGWFPNLKVRRSLSKTAKNMTPEIEILLRDGQFAKISRGPRRLNQVDYPVIPYHDIDDPIQEGLTKLHEEGASSSGISNQGYPAIPMNLSQRLEYRLPYTQKILRALQDDQVKFIGIYGVFREIDRVTTKEFFRRIKQKDQFELVVMAIVSKNQDLNRIQSDVAEMLELPLENGSLAERADKLRARLSASDSKSWLVIFADVWGTLDLDAIGIPVVDNNKRCKIMLISQLSDVFSEMTTSSNFFELLSEYTPPTRPMEFASSNSVIRKVMDALTDEKSNPIVICGMEGIGKTTLLKEIGAKASDVDLFDDVALVEFPQPYDLRQMQEKLAKGLGLTLTEQDETAGAAIKLRTRLSESTKKVLIILDNVWAHFKLDLWTLGIPILRDSNCCKLLVSSRDLNVFVEMTSIKIVCIFALEEGEAWNLFKKMAGDYIESDHELRPIAQQVLLKCHRLPIAISTLGSALQKQEKWFWKDTLVRLQDPFKVGEDEDEMTKNVNHAIKLSYDFLEGEEAKSCFLVCCLYPKGTNIPVLELVKYALGLGVFQGINSIGTARHRVKSLVLKLKSCLLLSAGDGEDSVRMHDIVHKVGLFIASDQVEGRFVIGNGVSLKNWPRDSSFEKSTYCSLLRNNGVPELLQFSRRADIWVEPPPTILEGMEGLKVLDISHMCLLPILPSLALLNNLQTLRIFYSHIEYDAVSVIGTLGKLKVLELNYCWLTQLPSTFSNLSNLTVLILSGCSDLAVISPGILSGISQSLEELYMWGSFYSWEAEKLASTETTNWISQLEDECNVDVDNEDKQRDLEMWERLNRLAVQQPANTGEHRREVQNAYHRSDMHTRWADTMDWTVGLLSELLSLSHLTCLEVVLPPVDIILQTSQLFHKLERFKIFIGWQRYHNYWESPPGNYLRLHDLNASSLVGGGMSFMLKKTNVLELKMKNLTDPLNILDAECCSKLKSLAVEDCNAMKYLIDMTLPEQTPYEVFPRLSFLDIKGASSLKEIIHGEPPKGSLKCLKNLVLQGLPALTNFWKIKMPFECQLEELKVKDFESLETIFVIEGLGHHKEDANELRLSFVNLTRLALNNLPNFTGISKRLPEVFSLETSSIVSVQLLVDSEVDFPVLRELEIECLDSFELIWKKPISPNSFCELRTLTVTGCGELLLLVPKYMQNILQKLEKILVSNCSSLDGIFEDEAHAASTISQADETPSNVLQRKGISVCWGGLWSQCLGSRMQTGQVMQIHKNMDSKESRQIHQSLKNLTTINIYNCNRLRYLMSPQIAKGLVNLKTLQLADCMKIKEIVASAEGEGTEDTIILPQLSYLKLFSLSNLATFSQGNYSFDFPLLESIEISRCEEMMKFCSGTLTIPSEVEIVVIYAGENVEKELNKSRKEACSDSDTRINIIPIFTSEEHDAWNLFKKMAGDYIESDELRPIAQQVLLKCHRLPIAISTLGSALQKQEISFWKDTLVQLQIPFKVAEEEDEMTRNVYPAIKLSYDYLEREAKSFFILCCLYPKGTNIPVLELVKYVVGLGVFQGIHSIGTARDRVTSIVLKLKSCFLLSTSDMVYGEESVRMHDVVHKVGSFIASDQVEGRFVIGNGVELKNWPHNSSFEKSTYCSSLRNDGVTELLRLVSCRTDNWVEPPPTILEGMECLKVLVLSHMFLLPILPSLALLNNLQTLRIYYSHIEYDAVSVIGTLEKLKVLELNYCWLPQLPSTFSKLSNLTVLILSDCTDLAVISPGIISGISRSLEELYMWGSFYSWEAEKLASTETTNWISQLEDECNEDVDNEDKQRNLEMWKRLNRLAVEQPANTGEHRREVQNAYHQSDMHTSWADSMDWTVGVLSELLSLSHLTCLEVVLPPVDIILRISQLFHKLEKFKIFIGWKNYQKYWDAPPGNYLRLHDLNASSLVGGGISFLLKKTNVLELKMKNLTDPLNILDAECCANLKSLAIEDCYSLKYLIDMKLEEETPRSVFPLLSFLDIEGASSLKEIIHGEPPNGSLKCLKNLVLQGLPALTNFWKINMQSECLRNLEFEELKLQKCPSLETVVVIEESGNHVGDDNQFSLRFVNLTRLALNDLPNFTGMSKRLPEVINLETSSVVSVRHLVDSEVYFPVLRELEIESLDRFELIWKKPNSPDSFCELRALKVNNCGKLLHLVPKYMQNRLQKLKKIDVSYCSSLEGIFEDEYEANSASTISPDSSELRDLKVNNCGKLLHLVPKYMESRLQKLETIDVSYCCSLEGIFEDKDEAHAASTISEAPLRNLTSLIIHQCHRLSVLLSSDMAKSVQLKHLQISECQMMEQIVLPAESSEENMNMFSKLKHLELCDLPNLTSFCSGSHIEFQSLERFKLDKCTKLETFIVNPSRKSILAHKGIEKTDMYERVAPFFLFDEKVRFPRLERLTINDLPKLTTIWRNQLAQDAFCSLKDVTVKKCNSLINILPDSMVAVVFQQLQKLTVEECAGVEEIVAQDVGETLILPDQLVFPKLTCLECKSLPQLKRFYPRIHVFKFPQLNTLVSLGLDCCISDMFAVEFSSLQKMDDMGGPCTPVKQSFVLKEKSSFFDLEDLIFQVGIWYGPPAPAAFHEQALILGHTDDLHLKTLRLHGMEKLTGPTYPDELDILVVKFCGLNNLELSSISFENLTILEVTFCWKLQYLTTYAVAKSLEKLKKLKVDECKGMKEILASNGVEEDADDCKIVFSKLQRLELSDLVSLERFCSSNFVVHVPALETDNLEVNWCPFKLKISSNGVLEEDFSILDDSKKEEAVVTTVTDQKQPVNSEKMDHNESLDLNHKRIVTSTSEADLAIRISEIDEIIRRLQQEREKLTMLRDEEQKRAGRQASVQPPGS